MAGRPPGPEKTPFPLRIEPKILETIRYCADAELRSVNSQIEVLLREALRARGLLKNEKKG